MDGSQRKTLPPTPFDLPSFPYPLSLFLIFVERHGALDKLDSMNVPGESKYKKVQKRRFNGQFFSENGAWFLGLKKEKDYLNVCRV